MNIDKVNNIDSNNFNYGINFNKKEIEDNVQKKIFGLLDLVISKTMDNSYHKDIGKKNELIGIFHKEFKEKSFEIVNMISSQFQSLLQPQNKNSDLINKDINLQNQNIESENNGLKRKRSERQDPLNNGDEDENIPNKKRRIETCIDNSNKNVSNSNNIHVNNNVNSNQKNESSQFLLTQDYLVKSRKIDSIPINNLIKMSSWQLAERFKIVISFKNVNPQFLNEWKVAFLECSDKLKTNVITEIFKRCDSSSLGLIKEEINYCLEKTFISITNDKKPKCQTPLYIEDLCTHLLNYGDLESIVNKYFNSDLSIQGGILNLLKSKPREFQHKSDKYGSFKWPATSALRTYFSYVVANKEDTETQSTMKDLQKSEDPMHQDWHKRLLSKQKTIK